MAGNAIAWKEQYAEAPPVRREGWREDVSHLINAVRLLILADRTEAQEQARLRGR